MDITQLKALFEKHRTEYLKFTRIENKYSKRPTLHALILIDKILDTDVEDQCDIISGATSDEIFLEPMKEELARLARLITEEQVIELIRCGVRYNDYGFLSIFV
jgi:hypothetical protein